MKILIIGCGYAGTAVASHWKKEGHEVTVATRSASRIHELEEVASRVVVVTDKDYTEAIKGQECVVITVAPDRQNPNYKETYFDTAEAVIKSLDSSVKQIIYTSSTSVYGDQEGRSVDETVHPTPASDSSKTLLETENVLRSAANKNVNVCIFRLGEIIGPERMIADKLQRMQGMVFPGTGEHLTNMVHLEDIVKALDLALNEHLEGIFNLCNDIHIPRKELYHKVCKEQGLPEVIWDPTKPSFFSDNKVVSNQKIKSKGVSFTNAY